MKKVLLLFLLLLLSLSLSACTFSICSFYGTEIIVPLDEADNVYHFCDNCTANYSEFFDDVMTPQTPTMSTNDPEYYGEEDYWVDEYDISVEAMADGWPYLLSDGIISAIADIEVREDCLTAEQIARIPTVSEGSQIIMQSSSSELEEVNLYPMYLETDLYINPYVRFYYRPDTNVFSITYMHNAPLFYSDTLSDPYEVDNIDGISLDADLPIYNWKNVYDQPAYFLASNSPCEYTVGYWKGTNYIETVFDVSHTPVAFDPYDSYYCGFTKTYDGYFVVDLPNLESGYYVLRTISNSFAIYIE